jgi:hypothetical protein
MNENQKKTLTIAAAVAGYIVWFMGTVGSSVKWLALPSVEQARLIALIEKYRDDAGIHWPSCIAVGCPTATLGFTG